MDFEIFCDFFDVSSQALRKSCLLLQGDVRYEELATQNRPKIGSITLLSENPTVSKVTNISEEHN